MIWKWNQSDIFDSSQPITQLQFEMIGSGDTDIEINTAILRDSDNNTIEIDAFQNGQILEYLSE